MAIRFPPDFLSLDEVASLSRRGVTARVINGVSEDIGTTAFGDIWPVPGTRTWLQAPERLRIISDDAADDATGPGAQSVLIQGLNISGIEIQETLVTAGTSVSALTTQFFFRHNFSVVGAVGVYNNANVGRLRIETESGILQATIEAGESETCHVHFTVPSNRLGLIYLVIPGVDANKSAVVRFLVRQDAGKVTAPFQPQRVVFRIPGLLGTVPVSVKAPAFLSSFTDLWFDAKGSSPNTVVSITLVLILTPGG